MSTFKIPNDGNIRQLNRGDIYGEIWASKNIDLSTSPGKIKLARPTEQVMTNSELENEAVEALVGHEDYIYVLTDETLFRDRSPFNGFSSVVTTGLSNGEDMVVFNGEVLISENTDIGQFDGSYTSDWWSSTISGSALTSGVPHILHVLRASGKDTLAVTDGNRLRYYNTTAGHTSFTWDASLIACCQDSGLNFGWVGTYNENDGNAEVIAWQVGNDAYTQTYPIKNAKAVLAIKVVDNIPYILTERGEIQKFNQAGFSTIATLPLWNEPGFLSGVRPGSIQSNNTSRPVHPKGMDILGDKLLIYVNAESSDFSSNVNERFNSGLYEVDLITGSVSHRMCAAGDTLLRDSGPILTLNEENSRIYFSGRLDTADGSSDYGLWREDLTTDATNNGYFALTELQSSSVEDNYEKIVLAALNGNSGSLTAKYRLSKDTILPVEADINWLDSTSFTTTDDLSDVVAKFSDDPSNIEVELLSDTGDIGHAQVTSIESSENTYTVVVDTAIGTAAAGARVRFDNWTAIADVYNTEDLIKEIGLDRNGPQLHLKIWLYGANGYPEISRLVVKSNNKQSL